MSRSVSPTRVVIAVGAVAGALALAGCGAGQIAQTSVQLSAVDGASANVGEIGVRGAVFPFAGEGTSAVIYPSGGTAPLMMSVVNTGGLADKLTGASSPVAASVDINGDARISAGKLLLVSGEPTPAPVAPSASAGARASANATATPTVAPRTAVAATSAPAPSGAANESAAGESTATAGAAAPTTGPSIAGTTYAQVVLTGLKQNLQAGLTYPVVLTFQRAGDVIIQVPIANPGEASNAG